MSTETKSTNWFSRLNRKVVIAGAAGIVVVVALGAAILSPEDKTREEEFFTAEKGNFLVTIVEGGTLEAVNEVSIRNDVKYSTKIVKIVPEGTYVKKGDLLCELDVSEIEDRLDEQKLTVESAEFTVTQAQENLKIQESINDSSIKAAQLKVEFARTDLEKYVQGDWPQLKREAEAAKLSAREQKIIDEEALEWAEKLAKEGYETKRNVDTARNKFLNSEIKLEQSQEALKLMEKYDFPKQKRQYEANLQEAIEELERAKQQAASRISQYEAEVRSAENKLELQQKKLEEYLQQIDVAKIHAPESGLVIYPFVSFRSQSQSMIEEGASVRPRQELMKLPDVSSMKVTIKVHESHVNQLVDGMPAYVVLDSLPDQRFKAHVSKVSLMPDQQSRFSNPDLKVYSTEILIDGQLPDVKPGLSARAEVIITNLENVIKVPVQCVTTHDGKQVCYVRRMGGSEPVPVEVGLYNTKFIEIKSGLEPGDQVLLSPPMDAGDAGGLDDTLMEEGEEVPETKPLPPPAQSPQLQRGGRGESPGEGEGGQQRRRRAPDPERIKQFDKDGDGKLDESEREAMREFFRSQRSGSGAGGGPRSGGGGGPRSGGAGGGGEQPGS